MALCDASLSRLLLRVAPERGVLGMGRYVLAVIFAQALLASAASLVGSVSSSLKSRGDGPVVTMALCGAGRSSVVGEALGVEGSSTCTLVSAPTPLALLDVPSAESADGTTAAVVADVLSLEVRFTDLVERTAHGLRQLLPLLQRSVRLRDVRPQPKLLLLTVTDFDASAVSEADVSAFVASQIEALVSSLALPAEEPVLTSADLLQLKCFFLPSKVHKPDAYDTALASLRDALVADSSSGYLLGDSRWMQPASNVVANVGQAAERAPAAPQARAIITTAHTRTARSLACSLPVFAVFLGSRLHARVPAQASAPAEVHAAYQCGLLAEAAAREFQKGASALRKSADGTLVRLQARCPPPTRPPPTANRARDSARQEVS